MPVCIPHAQKWPSISENKSTLEQKDNISSNLLYILYDYTMDVFADDLL